MYSKLSGITQVVLTQDFELVVLSSCMRSETLDCLVIGGGPAGLTAAIYLARFRRNFLVIDAGESRARLIPTSHNYSGFPEGVAGPDLLSRMKRQAEKYGAKIETGTVKSVEITSNGIFIAKTATELLHTRNILLATGVVDLEPRLPNIEGAISKGLVRHCSICDGYEARDSKIAIIGNGSSGLDEALFLRTYSPHITLLSLGEKLELSALEETRAKKAGIVTVEESIDRVMTEGDRIIALVTGSGVRYDFDTLYSALGTRARIESIRALEVSLFEDRCVEVDSHMRTNIVGLYAAGDVIKGLDQISTAIGNAAIAATAIHNRLRERE
jgi:thioredoxin reductase (NADPH)